MKSVTICLLSSMLICSELIPIFSTLKVQAEETTTTETTESITDSTSESSEETSTTTTSTESTSSSSTEETTQQSTEATSESTTTSSTSSDDTTESSKKAETKKVVSTNPYEDGTDTGASKLTAKVNKLNTVTSDTIRGIDLTVYQAQLKANVAYKNFDGTTLNPTEFMQFLKSTGINYVNLKVAVNPNTTTGATYGGGNPTLENAIATAKLAHVAGLKVNINFLMSDFYTTASNQKLPKGWDSANLAAQSTGYIKASMAKLIASGVSPEMVTIGSFMTEKFLGQYVGTGNAILKAITTEVRSAAPSALIALNYASPKKDWFETLANNLERDGVSYDILSTGVYAAWNSLSDIKGAKQAAVAANKGFVVGSVSYAFTDKDSDGKQNDSVASDILNQNIGEVSPQGQASYIRSLYAAITTQKNNQSNAGVFYDNAVWIAVKAGTTNWEANKNSAETNGTGWAAAAAADYVDGAAEYSGASTVDNQALFDSLGQPLQSLTVFSQLLTGATGADTVNNDEAIVATDPYQTGSDTGLKEQAVTINKLTESYANDIRGVDISSYQALKNAGVKFYNYEGKEESLLKILHDNGVNYIRLKIWNDPKNSDGAVYGGGDNDVATSLAIAKEASQYGMKVLLNFHYSDFWADPAQQLLPKAWQGLNSTEIESSVYNFTKATIKQFQDANVDVGMVQIGNEITNGTIGIYSNRDAGESWTNVWGNEEKSKQINKYLKSGIKAVHDSKNGSSILTILHLETPDVTKYKTIMDTWKRDGVQYDILGSSYYNYWSVSDGNNTPENLVKVQNLASEYGKLFSVMETGWVNSLENSDGTPDSISADQSDWQNTNAFTVGPQGQVDELTSLYNTLSKSSNTLGAFYWEPAWLAVYAGWNNWNTNKEASDIFGSGWASKGAVGYFPDSKMYYNGSPAWGGSSWENQALFDSRGYALQSLKFYSQAFSTNEVQQTKIRYVDAETGTEIQTSTFEKVVVGKEKTITLPKIDGYTLAEKSSSYDIKGTVAGVKTVTIEYKKNKASETDDSSSAKTSTIAVRRGNQYLFKYSLKTGVADKTISYGKANDTVLVGDWDGDGKDTLAVRRGNKYYIKNSISGGEADLVIAYGKAGDTVLVGDWDGDGKDTLAVRRGNKYYIKNSISGGQADKVVAYGKTNDTVLVGDWNGDNKDTLAVRRNNTYYIKNSISGGKADKVVSYGKANDTILVGDWNGKGKDTLAVRRGNQYYLKYSISGGNADKVIAYGKANDVILVGKWK